MIWGNTIIKSVKKERKNYYYLYLLIFSRNNDFSFPWKSIIHQIISLTWKYSTAPKWNLSINKYLERIIDFYQIASAYTFLESILLSFTSIINFTIFINSLPFKDKTNNNWEWQLKKVGTYLNIKNLILNLLVSNSISLCWVNINMNKN